MKRKLHITILMCLLALSGGAQVLYSEDFSSQALPAGWTNDSLGQPAVHVWVFNNPFARAISGAGFDANFAIFDSDEGNSDDGFDENAQLTTGDVNISTATVSLYLTVDEQYRSLLGPNTGGSQRLIEYSTDAGVTWTTLVFDSVDYGYPNPAAHSEFDITSLIGQTNVRFRFSWVGSWDWWWAIDNLQVVSRQDCAGTPNAGSAAASVATACPHETFSLHLTGNDQTLGLTYQWQNSPDDLVWTDIPGATNASLDTSQTTVTYYRCNVTCSISAQTSASASVMVALTSSSLCYCTPPHTVDCTGANSMITNVTITGTSLNNTSSCDQLTAQAYTFWPVSFSTTAELTRGNAYDFSVTTDNDNIISIWIDFDQSGSFEPSEWVQVCTTSVAATPTVVNWTIPLTATQGATLMRVRSRLTGNQNGDVDACLDFGSGESEDYYVGLDYNVGEVEFSADGFGLYPNPATDAVTVFFGSHTDVTSVKLYDQLGNLLLNNSVSKKFSTKLDLSNYSKGIYFITIESAKGMVKKRIVHQ